MRILYVTTVSDTLNAFLIPHIQLLREMGHTVDVACNIVQPLKPELLEAVGSVERVDFQRSVVNKKNVRAYKTIRQIMIEGQYDVVHTHTPIASACVRLAARSVPGTKIYYTAHGFHFYKRAHLKNWLVYFPVEYMLSILTDTLITINQEDYHMATRLLKADRTRYIPGVGIDVDRFSKARASRLEKRQELGLSEQSFVLLSIGELNENKNHEIIIRALRDLNQPDFRYVICGTGPLEEELRQKVEDWGLQRQVRLLGYRTDIDEICQMADVFVFPSYREGLPVSVMEAMAAGLPIVASNIRGNTDLVTDGYNGYLHHPDDLAGFVRSIQHIHEDQEKIARLGQCSRERLKVFSRQNVLRELRQLYELTHSRQGKPAGHTEGRERELSS